MSDKLEIRGINKKFGKQVILDDINVEFETGHIYGMFGRNGVGKSTLCNIMADKLYPDSGEVCINGEKISKNSNELKKICHIKETDIFSTDIKVKNVLKAYRYFFENYDKELEERLIKRFDINVKKTYGKLSRGQKSMVMIIAGLSSNAEITIFDEPTIGLDVANRKIFYEELMQKYSETMNTYIITTHLVEEMEKLIEKVVIINNKSIKINEDIEDLKEKSYLITGKSDDLKNLSFYDEVKEYKKFASTETVFYYGKISGDDEEYIKSKDLKLEKPTLEDIFLKTTEEVR